MKMLPPHAPRTIAAEEVQNIQSGDMLCSEPWYPCWNPATHYRKMENGTVSLRCTECCDTEASTVKEL